MPFSHKVDCCATYKRVSGGGGGGCCEAATTPPCRKHACIAKHRSSTRGYITIYSLFWPSTWCIDWGYQPLTWELCSLRNWVCLSLFTFGLVKPILLGTMTTSPLSPRSTGQGKPEFSLPMPPPLLHTRSGNALYENEKPQTPTSAGFTSPYATPQGSPSKKQLPPGAHDLPNIFESSLNLAPTSPSKLSKQQFSPPSPNKGFKIAEDSFDNSVLQPDVGLSPGSSPRKYQENAPSAIRQAKEANFATNQAAISRQEPYQSRDLPDPASRSRFNTQRNLTTEELEKLQLPRVKRLANVTQLCKYARF